MLTITPFLWFDPQAEEAMQGGGPGHGGGVRNRRPALKDRFGLSWQIVPKRLGAMLGHADPAHSQRVMQAMLQRVKLDLPALQDAYDAG
jgi:predicted 3-demethylubiquinone-9 3-methyltransferase (glyoxalase superfamily)